MNQPLPITDKECVGRGYGEIVHQLAVVAEFNGCDNAGCAVGALNLVAYFQSGRRYPLSIGQAEGMFRCCFNQFAIYSEMDDKRVFMSSGGKDGVVAYFPDGMVGQDIVADC